MNFAGKHLVTERRVPSRLLILAGARSRARSRATVLMAAALILAWAAQADSQVFVSGDRALRVEWTAGPPKGTWLSICGDIHNDASQAIREVQLMIEGRDSSDQVIEARRASVLGYISPRGRTYFCSTAAAGAARYSVTIVGAQWGSER